MMPAWLSRDCKNCIRIIRLLGSSATSLTRRGRWQSSSKVSARRDCNRHWSAPMGVHRSLKNIVPPPRISNSSRKAALQRPPIPKRDRLAAAGAVSQHRIEGGLDGADKGVLIGKLRIAVVDQHRRVGFEDHKMPVWIEPEVNAEIIKPETLAHRAQRLILRGIEDSAGISEECRFLLLHPMLVGHIGRGVVHLPVVSDRKVVRQDIFADEDEAVFAEMAVVGDVVDVFDDVVVVHRISRETARELIEALDFFEVVAAMCAYRAD